MNVEVICQNKCELGEGPVWDEKRRTIFWLDILKGLIHEYSIDEKNCTHYVVGEMIGSFALTEDGNMVTATKNGFGMVNRKTGEFKILINPESDKPNNRFNDGKCDPAGRFWAGTMSLKGEDEAGSLYIYDGKKVVKKLGNVSISNGIVWTADMLKMYYIDTPTLEVKGFDYDNSSGEISNSKVIIKIDPKDGYPDGMTIDTEGMLWIAHWGGWQVTRWDPQTGEKISSISLPAAQITSCTFGGPEMEDLFITSAKTGISPEQLENQPLAGSLFVIRKSGFSGYPSNRFTLKI
ncbi:MAG: hypothetical protein RJA52_1492, partial [Bacteroidota bacterium]